LEGVQEFKEYKEYKEFEERSQEPESRSREAQYKGRGLTETTILSKKLGPSFRNLLESGIAGPWVSGH